jgi:PAS domain S-box-containing protein
LADRGTDTAFLAGDGATADLIARHDWSGSLGPPGQWPQSLKTTVGLMLHSPVPLVLLWGTDGIMLYNDAYSVFAGNRHPRLLGSKVLEGWPEVADLNAHVMKVGLAGGTLEYKDRELVLNRRGTPETGWMDLFYSPVIDESGKPGGVIAVVVETTERVLAGRKAIAEREALRESEQRLQMALSAGDGVGTWDWDVQKDRVVADARFAMLYGVDPQRARGGAPIAKFFAGIHPDDISQVQSRVAEAIRTGEMFSEEYRLVQPDGRVRWVIAQGRCTLAADGTPLRFPGVSFDITPRKAARRNCAPARNSFAPWPRLFPIMSGRHPRMGCSTGSTSGSMPSAARSRAVSTARAGPCWCTPTTWPRRGRAGPTRLRPARPMKPSSGCAGQTDNGAGIWPARFRSRMPMARSRAGSAPTPTSMIRPKRSRRCAN